MNPGGPPGGTEQLRNAHEDGTTTAVEGAVPGASEMTACVGLSLLAIASAVLSKWAHKGVERPEVQSGDGGRESMSTVAKLSAGGGWTIT